MNSFLKLLLPLSTYPIQESLKSQPANHAELKRVFQKNYDFIYIYIPINSYVHINTYNLHW